MIHKLKLISARIKDKQRRIDAWYVSVCLAMIIIAVGVAILAAINEQ